MPTRHRLTPTLIAVLAIGLLAMSGSAGAEPFGDRIAGTWMAMLTIPPNPLLGNTEQVTVPEYFTIHADGTGLAQMSVPAFPVPVDGTPVPALMGVGVAAWEKVAPKRLRMTTLRFLSDMQTGDPLAILKAYVEFEQVTPDLMQGAYVVEVLDLDGNTMRFGGQPLVLGGDAVQSRLPVERIPEQ